MTNIFAHGIIKRTKEFILYENLWKGLFYPRMKPTLSPDQQSYRKKNVKNLCVILGLAVLTFLLLLISLNVGQSKMSFAESVRAFFGVGDDVYVSIIRYVRLPRILAAIVVGFGLAIAGHILQTTLKNPLASPSTLGVSNAAAFGANLAIVLGAGTIAGASSSTVLNVNNPYVVAVAAFLFSFGTVLFILFIAQFRKFSPVTVVLLGVAFGAIFTALTTFLQYISDEQTLAAAVYWSFGDLARANYVKIAVMAACVFPSFIVFFALRWKYNALSSGEEGAKSLGVRLSALRLTSLLLSSLVTAVCVSFVGVIGFVGIVCPQLLKRVVGADTRFLLPASGLAGSALLLLSDTIARVVVPGMNLPVGAVTAILGAPIFIYVLLRRDK